MEKAFNYFDNKYGGLIETSQNFYSFPCPFCIDGFKKRKMAVSFHTGLVKCWVCGYTHNITTFIVDTEGCSRKEVKDYVGTLSTFERKVEVHNIYPTMSNSFIDLPKGFKFLDEEGPLQKKAYNYLITERGYNESLIRRLSIGYVDTSHVNTSENFFGRIIFPFKVKGRVVYFVGRDFLNRSVPPYKNPSKEFCKVGKTDLFYNQTILDDPMTTTVVLVEGVTDAMTLYPYAIASLGWALSPVQVQILRNSSVQHLIVFAEKGFRQTIAQQLLPLFDRFKIKLITLDHLEDNQKDPAGLGRVGCEKLISETPFIDFKQCLQHIWQ